MQLLQIPTLPFFEQLPQWCAGGLDGFVAHGRLTPLCLATLLTYLLILSHRYTSR